MSQVSQLSGYSSQRRFNDHLVSSYGCTPSQLRNKTKHHATKVPSLSLQLHYRPPYDWDALLEFLSIRSIPGVEVIEAGEYRRSIRLGGQYCLLRVRQDKANHRLLCNITPAPESELLLVTEKLRNMFDLYADPIEIDKVLSLEPRLQQNLKRHPGLRIPGCWDGFETCIRAIVGQQISVTGAITIVGRIVARYGTACDLGAGVTHVFPSSQKLSKELELDHLAMPRARAQAIANVCHANASGAIDFEQMGVEELMKNYSLRKAIGAILSLKLNKIIGYRFQKQIEIAHQFLNQHKQYAHYYNKAIKITDVQDLGDVMIDQLTELFSEDKKKTMH
jgi:AraC family transcriptional regulator of adaptative response / DNA-3-methyladenine glycosylase II